MADMTAPHQHDFVVAASSTATDPRVFVCSVCGITAVVGGALSNPQNAHDASYRPDLPLRSTDADVAKWADEIRKRP